MSSPELGSHFSRLDGEDLFAFLQPDSQFSSSKELLTFLLQVPAVVFPASGDVLNISDVKKACEGQDAILSALGTGKSRKETTVYSAGRKYCESSKRAPY